MHFRHISLKMWDPIVTNLALKKCPDLHVIYWAMWEWLFTARTCSRGQGK